MKTPYYDIGNTVVYDKHLCEISGGKYVNGEWIYYIDKIYEITSKESLGDFSDSEGVLLGSNSLPVKESELLDE